MSLSDKPWRDLRPDAQAFDEVRITTIPRYKTSGLSGDEWRISASVEFYRKGRLQHERSFGNVETACKYLYTAYNDAIERGKAFFAGEDNLCDQEGCAETATVTYKKRQDYCNQGHPHPIAYSQGKIRRFCSRHSTRGNCGLDDADRNYEILQGEATKPQEQDESPSSVVVVEASRSED